MAIAVSGVTKRFGSTAVLAGVDLEVPDGSVTAILGGSGSGKTTLLRIIAGIEAADAGTVAIGGAVVDDGHHRVPARHRGVGYVPQDGALFPHLTVAANVGFGLARSARHRVAPMLVLADLVGLEGRYPHQLSGGQQQRVALARALAVEPEVLLLDEPFSSLDTALRTSVRQEVARVLAATGTTTVMVTHDRDEALAMADQVAILRHGRVAASGEPRRLYDAPDGPEAATWVGEANLVAAEVRGGLAHCALGELPVAPGTPDGPSRLLVRPEQLVLDLLARPGAVTGVVERWQYHGHDATASVRLGAGGPLLLARVPSSAPLGAGQEVRVSVRGPCRAWPDGAAATPAAGEGAGPGVA